MTKFNTEVNLCTCNNCDEIFVDTNPQIKAKRYFIDKDKVKTLVLVKEQKTANSHAWGCPTCKTDDFLSDEINEQEAMGRGIIDTY